jgi:hypothetical protein
MNNVVRPTSHNAAALLPRTVYAPQPRRGCRHEAARAAILQVNRCAHSHAKPPPHFVRPANAAHLLIRAAKMSSNMRFARSETLCAIRLKFFG